MENPNNGTFSLAEIMSQLEQLNEEGADISTIGDSHPLNSVLPTEDISLDLETQDNNREIVLENGDGIVFDQVDEEQDEDIDLEPPEEMRKEFTIVEAEPDMDPNYNREVITDDGAGSEIEIEEAEEGDFDHDNNDHDNNHKDDDKEDEEEKDEKDEKDEDDDDMDIELDLGGSDHAPDDEEESDPAYLQEALATGNIENAELALGPLLIDEDEEPSLASAPPSTMIVIPDVVQPTIPLGTEQPESPIYVPDEDEISVPPMTMPLLNPKWMDVNEATMASENLSALILGDETPAMVAEETAPPVLIIEPPPTSLLNDERLSNLEIVTGPIEEAVASSSALVVSTEEAVQDIVEEVKATEKIEEDVKDDIEEIVEQAPKVQEEIVEAIEEETEKVQELKEAIEEAKEEIIALESNPAETVSEQAAVAENVTALTAEIEEAQAEVQEHVEEIGRLNELSAEQIKAVETPLPIQEAVAVVETIPTQSLYPDIRVSQIFIPKTQEEISFIAPAKSTPAVVIQDPIPDKARMLKLVVSETINGGLNTAGNIAQRFNRQLQSNLIYVPTVQNTQQMSQFFASIDSLNASQLDLLLGLNLKADQRKIYRDLRTIKNRKQILRNQKSQIEEFEEKVERFRTHIYVPSSSVLTAAPRARLQYVPKSTNISASRRPLLPNPPVPKWAK